MLSRLRPRLTYADVVSTLCLFIVLGGTSYAVATGSIDSREIKNGTIRSKDIRNNQVSTSDVRNGSLLSRDFKSGQLPAGPRGKTGAQGVKGDAGVTNVVVRIAAGPSPQTASCLPAEKLVGGGAATSGGGFLVRSRPDPSVKGGTPTGWHALALTTVGVPVPVDAYAVCASP